MKLLHGQAQTVQYETIGRIGNENNDPAAANTGEQQPAQNHRNSGELLPSFHVLLRPLRPSLHVHDG